MVRTLIRVWVREGPRFLSGVGRWCSASAAISIGLIDAPSDPVLWEVVCFVYVPAAALALAAGVAVRVFVRAALGKRKASR